MVKNKPQKKKSNEINRKEKKDLEKMDSSADSSMNSGDESKDVTDNVDISHASQASMNSSDFDYSYTTESGESLISSPPGGKQPLFSLFSSDVRDRCALKNVLPVNVPPVNVPPVNVPPVNVNVNVFMVTINQIGSQYLSHTKDGKTSVNNLMGLVSIGIIIVAVMAVMTSRMMTKEEAPPYELNSYEQFVNKIEAYKMLFPSQNQRFWKTIKASGRHVLNVTSPDYPAVLLFVANTDLNMEDKFDASSCLARKISAEFDAASKLNSGRPPIVDCAKLDRYSSDRQKLDFDHDLNRYLSGNYKSVIVEHLELLTPTAALMLHGYCDGDNAPFKDVMIILVLRLDNDNLDHRSAEKLLKTSWQKELRSDKVDALMSRVANNIVIVQPESNKLSTHCT